jgi:Raf kinase inhibitor-like YbhB/YbcL family protein
VGALLTICGEKSMENLIISVDFDKGEFPKKYTCDGENVSPPISIERISSQFLAITIEDWIGPSEKICQWLIWNIKARDIIPENIPGDPVITEPIDAVQGKNDLGKIGYSGPCPPKGEVHTYYFNVYGLDAKLDVLPGSTRKDLEKAMAGHMIQYGGQSIATYQR